jgi:hypothetical protein
VRGTSQPHAYHCFGRHGRRSPGFGVPRVRGDIWTAGHRAVLPNSAPPPTVASYSVGPKLLRWLTGHRWIVAGEAMMGIHARAPTNDPNQLNHCVAGT